LHTGTVKMTVIESLNLVFNNESLKEGDLTLMGLGTVNIS